VVELGPRQRNFVPAAHAVQALLNGDLALMRVGPGRYLSRQALPPWVKTVPEVLMPEVVPLAPRERSLDVALPLERLAPGLAERVMDPFYEDQGETEVSLAEIATSETTLPVLSHHHACGTLKLRQQDQRLYDQPGPVSVVTFVTPEGVSLPIWVNQETRLLYGFLTWFQQTLPPCGALVTIQRDPEDAERYFLLHEGETDPGTYISQARFEQLTALRDRLRRKRPFLVNVVTALLQVSDKGLAFDQLWSQVNVIRRTTRLLLASTLTAYEQFEDTGSGRWRLV
jgi:hypothetical protein